MALEITYHQFGGTNPNMPGLPISSETRTLSGTSAQSGATPGTAAVVLLHATEACRYAYAADPTATGTAGVSGHYLAAGAERWIPAVTGWKVAGITAS